MERFNPLNDYIFLKIMGEECEDYGGLSRVIAVN
jgi:hypothetical protein